MLSCLSESVNEKSQCGFTARLQVSQQGKVHLPKENNLISSVPIIGKRQNSSLRKIHSNKRSECFFSNLLKNLFAYLLIDLDLFSTQNEVYVTNG